MRIIKFSALWCPSCLIMNSRINKIVGKYNIDIVEYDYDIDEDMVSKYNVESILPVIIFINNDDLEKVLYTDITQINYGQTFSQSIFKIGTITLHTKNEKISKRLIVMNEVRDVKFVYEKILEILGEKEEQ